MISTAVIFSALELGCIYALVALGYDGLTASRAVSAVEEAKNVEELITKALRKLAR